jgi:hypothetical protein
VIGRRIPVPADGHPIVEQPGDYCGPVYGFTGELPAVFFLKPNARDPDAPPRARSVQHVCSPPHTFTEEPDGTLTITASIGDTAGPDSGSDGWHGYLTKGEWHLA